MGVAVLCVLLLVPVFGHAFLVEGDKAPDFTAESLDHQTFGLSDYSGKIVVLFLLTTSNSTGNSSDTGSMVPGRVKAR